MDAAPSAFRVHRPPKSGRFMSIRIGIGAGIGGSLSPPDYWRWIDYCEDNGIDSIWHSDQLLGATLEPLALLAALAARTRRMRFGTNALVMAFRDPIVVAKELAAIDFLSEGRLLPVFGVGNAHDPYWAATRANARERGRRSNEAITLVRLLLEADHVEFTGAHFRYHGHGIQPRPAKPIPLWTGGHSPAAIRRTAELGDGWLGGLVSPAVAGESRRRIEAALVETGRSIDADHYGVSLPLRIGDADDPAVIKARERLLNRLPESERASVAEAIGVGTVDEIVALFRRHVAAGISKFVALPIADGAEDLLRQTQLLVRRVLPEIEDRPVSAAY